MIFIMWVWAARGTLTQENWFRVGYALVKIYLNDIINIINIININILLILLISWNI